MNHLTGMTEFKNLPDETVVAITLLAGRQPCIVCAEACKDRYMVCSECNDAIIRADNTRSFIDYRDRTDVPDWFLMSRFGRHLSEKELTAVRSTGDNTVRHSLVDSKSSGKALKSRNPR